MPEISFIVPVYKVAEYVEECIASILEVEAFTFEILIIDDASPDNSIEIIKANFGSDTRIRIIRFKHNKGVSKARNAALKVAKGRYIIFVDSDDYIAPQAFEYIYQYFVKEHQPDACGINCRRFKDGTQPKAIRVPQKPPQSLKIYTGHDFFSTQVNNMTIQLGACSYILKRAFLHANDLFFKDMRLEDTEFVPRLCYAAANIINSNLTYYYYRDRAASFTRDPTSLKPIYLKKLCELQTEFAKSIPQTQFSEALHTVINLNILHAKLTYMAAERKEMQWTKAYLKINYNWSFKMLIHFIFTKYCYPLALIFKSLKRKWALLK